MSKHFVKNISFENFKCFKELKYDGFKRVNLIGGKNNIGKTSFMEGLNLALSSNNVNQLYLNINEILIKRRKESKYYELDFIYSNEDNLSIHYNKYNLKIHINSDYKKFFDKNKKLSNIDRRKIQNFLERGYKDFLELKVNKEKDYFPAMYYKMDNREYILARSRIRDMKSVGNNIIFIPPLSIDENKIAAYYGNIVNLNMESYIDKCLKLFDENIIRLKQLALELENKVILKLQMKDIEAPILLSSLGEGINRYLAILCAIWASKYGYLFIDEIENGIHYTNYSKLWELIFSIYKEANCQIFATTHSKECISAFNKQNSSNEGLYLEFYRNKKTNLINIKGRDNKLLEYSLNNNGEFRGE